ncbi:hypothetical protein Harman_24120 [Haloarcula mannanilytica]|uniref:Glycosyltransferase 2-like domain-containing protein n=1 Tax=Haloarcula mannanilytica TaxID=2509225 RepID=A0A4C2ELD0_9EURY|nr:glycosyltransferase family A protein [Haloarcula mannanilytica]GCF14477.1 hypothetical protein Harman_24120 [Haloarcula mannanilytica]
MTETLPFVSVIVPVYNDPDGIRKCLTALTDQTYPESRFEVLVVDNGSTDDTRSVVSDFPVTLLVEDEIQGSYAARNKGIRHTNGDIFAFVDADCTPEPAWIEAGIQKMTVQNADLVSGRVRFQFSADPTPAERFDAMVNMRNDKHEIDGFAKTANVFVRRSVVEDIGEFPAQLRSGGDVYWTQSATDRGHSLMYAPDAIVDHPSRQLGPLLSKMYRVGKGSIQLWSLQEDVTASIVFFGLLSFPVKVFRFLVESEGKSSDSGHETPPDRDVDASVFVYLVGVLVYGSLALGRLVGVLNLLREKTVNKLR